MKYPQLKILSPIATAFLLLVSINLFSQQARGPILRIQTDPINFDTTFCNTTKCRTITFTNVGDTALRVTSMDNILAPFSGNTQVPFTLNPTQSRTLTVCYRPTPPLDVDSQRIRFVADNRMSLSVGMVFDISGSMNQVISATDATTRIVAAHAAGVDFVSGLLSTQEVVDEAAVIRFADVPDYSVAQGFTTDKNLLTNAVPAAATGAATCIYHALRNAINLIAPRANQKVIILLTDGGDSGPGTCGTETVASVVAAANAAGVRIFTVGIGAADPTALTQVANGTFGQYFSADTRTDLISVYRRIATLLSQNVNGSFLVRGRGVSPTMTLTPVSLNFDSVRVGQSRCLPIVIRNTGDAPLDVTNIANVAPPFSFQTPPNISQLAPNAQVTLQVCFTPTRLRVQTSTFTFSHNSCTQQPLALSLRGVGYDSVTVALTDSFRVKPGTSIIVPIYLRDVLPATYDVHSFSLRVEYNKTVLIPSQQPLRRQGTLSEAFSNASLSESYAGNNAISTIQVSNGTLSSATPNSVLVNIGFTVLHGNSLTTAIQLTNAVFEDGNPRVGRIQPGFVVADSLCFQSQRLIDASQRMGASLAQNIPNPFSKTTSIEYTIPTDAYTRLIIKDWMGKEIARLVDGVVQTGNHSITFDASGLPSGIYFYTLETDNFSDTKKMIIAK